MSSRRPVGTELGIPHRPFVLHRPGKQLPGLRVPYPRTTVERGGGYSCAVPAEGHVPDGIIVGERCANRLACSGVPDPGDVVDSTRHNPLPVRAKLRRVNTVPVCKSPLRKASVQQPKPCRAVLGSSHQAVAAGTECGAPNASAMTNWLRQHCPCARVPSTGHPIPGGRNHHPAVRAELNVAHLLVVNHTRRQGLPRLEVPNPCHRSCSDCDSFSVGTEPEAPDPVVHKNGLEQPLPRFGVPKSHVALPGIRCHHVAVRTELRTGGSALVNHGRQQRQPCPGIPESCGLVIRHRDNAFAVRADAGIAHTALVLHRASNRLPGPPIPDPCAPVQ